MKFIRSSMRKSRRDRVRNEEEFRSRKCKRASKMKQIEMFQALAKDG